MKSILSIILCALFACMAIGLFLYQSGSGKLANVLGKPPIVAGAQAYDFEKKAIGTIDITQGESTQTYQRRYTYWFTQYKDHTVRADYSKLDQLLYMLETATIIDDIEPPKGEDFTHITLTSDTGEKTEIALITQLARFTGLEPPLIPSFAIKHDDGRYYACSSALEIEYPSLDTNSLVDHRPFFFHPDLLKEYSYTTSDHTLTLSRETPDSDWFITSPLNLRTDEQEVKKLIMSLYTFQASELEVEQAPELTSSPTISLKSFSPAIPPQSLVLSKEGNGYMDDAPFRYVFDDQKSSVLKSVDTLRSKKLAKIEVGEVSSILLQSKAQVAPVTLSILPTTSGAPRWMYQSGPEWLLASEQIVANLLSALTKDKVTDFSLETLPPNSEGDKSVTFNLKNGTQIHFDLFRAADKILIQRRDENYSAVLSTQHASKIQTEPTTWKDSKLWDFSSITLRGLQRNIKGRPLENYNYNFNLESWKGIIGEKSVDDDFDHVAANGLLTMLEGLQVKRWISTKQAKRTIGESSPVATLLTLSQKFGELGQSAGLETKTLTLYRMLGNPNQVLLSLQIDEQPLEYATIDKNVALRMLAPIVHLE